jgi:indole-3-glycerol phosphate synthase
LDRIVADHRAMAAADHRDEGDLEEAAERSEAARGFRQALAGPGLSVIAEVKRRSPSKGDLFPDLDPVVLASAYVAGGAACLSVLTDEEWFGGSRDDLQVARGAVPVPVLRKDFTVSRNDVCDARLMGADAVLLIVAALTQDELVDLHALAVAIGLDVLVEVHDEAEVTRAVDAGAALIGVNQRDLLTFEVDADRAARVRPVIPDGVVAVAESGIGGPHDAARAAADGYDAVLVGESLVRSGDAAAATRALVDAAAAATPEPLPFGE